MNKEEAWVCVDGHGDERIFPSKPYKDYPNMELSVNWGQRWITGAVDIKYRYGVLLPPGTIKFFIGKELTYKDEPVKL